ncbi:MAG: HDOD domain-containing protein [Rhodoferax sp.]|nr:HDOD domain-containing protein [Rhodoferax sp.]
MQQAEVSTASTDKLIVSLNDELVAIGIPPRPTILQSIEREMHKDEPDYSRLEQVVSLDVGVAASLLKIANSPFFGVASAGINTIKQALQILGLNIVGTAIAGLSLRKAFANVPNLERFWDGSACIAQISAWLCVQIPFAERTVRAEEVYTLALFRDAGIPVLLSNFSDYLDTLKIANSEAVKPFTDIEEVEFGVNHAHIGARLASEWTLSAEYGHAIEHHHDLAALQALGPDAIPRVSKYLIAISQLAEFLHQRATHQSHTLEWDKLGPACLEILDIAPERIQQLLEQMRAENVPLRPAF